MSSSTSTSSSSSEGDDDRGGVLVAVVGGGRQGGGGGDHQSEQPSSSRQRSSNEDFPDIFIESLAYQVAIDAIDSSSTSSNRLAAAQAVCTLFQVCTTWNSISHSPTLWHNLNRYVWRVDHPLPRITTHWRDEFIVHHRRYRNFRQSRFVYSTLHIVSQELYPPQCRCLAISDTHLACGFWDGTVRLYQLPQRVLTRTFPPHDRDRFGPLSWSVMGIALTNHNNNVVFGTVDGNIYAAELYGYESRRVHQGNVLNDGSLIDFAGNSEWWVGLYAGVPGSSFRVWNGRSETLVYVGGTLTDSDSLFGWRMLTEYRYPIGRVRIVEAYNVVVACSRTRIVGFDLRRPELILNDVEVQEGARVSTFDVGYDSFVLVNNRRMATVRRVDNFGVISRFSTRSHFGGIGFGCQNRDFALMSYNQLVIGSPIRVWDVERGHRLYDIGENVRNVMTLIADERYIVACSADASIHFWDHGNDENEE